MTRHRHQNTAVMVFLMMATLPYMHSTQTDQAQADPARSVEYVPQAQTDNTTTLGNKTSMNSDLNTTNGNQDMVHDTSPPTTIWSDLEMTTGGPTQQDRTTTAQQHKTTSGVESTTVTFEKVVSSSTPQASSHSNTVGTIYTDSQTTLGTTNSAKKLNNATTPVSMATEVTQATTIGKPVLTSISPAPTARTLPTEHSKSTQTTVSTKMPVTATQEQVTVFTTPMLTHAITSDWHYNGTLTSQAWTVATEDTKNEDVIKIPLVWIIAASGGGGALLLLIITILIICACRRRRKKRTRLSLRSNVDLWMAGNQNLYRRNRDNSLGNILPELETFELTPVTSITNENIFDVDEKKEKGSFKRGSSKRKDAPPYHREPSDDVFSQNGKETDEAEVPMRSFKPIEYRESMRKSKKTSK